MKWLSKHWLFVAIQIVKEYQKFETWRSQKLWESKADPRLRLKREGVI